MTKTDYDPDRSLVLNEGFSHFITNFLQNLVACHTALRAEMQVHFRKVLFERVRISCIFLNVVVEYFS
jgi:hypothetical protein